MLFDRLMTANSKLLTALAAALALLLASAFYNLEWGNADCQSIYKPMTVSEAEKGWEE